MRRLLAMDVAWVGAYLAPPSSLAAVFSDLSIRHGVGPHYLVGRGSFTGGCTLRETSSLLAKGARPA